MYYVIQVASGMEDKAEEQIRAMIEKGVYNHCFHPIRHVKKKIRGEWKELYEKLLPGYVFVTSNDVRELYLKLKYVPAFTKILGKTNDQFIPLPEDEVEWIEKIIDSADENMRVGISQIAVTENDEITILSGPLKNIEGCIRKIDLHRRIAKVEVDFMNRKTVIHLGVEMVDIGAQKQARLI